MRGYAGNAETCSLLQRYAFREWNNLLQGNHCVLGSGSEGAITLSAITPDAPTDPFPRYAIADRIDSAGTIAVRNDAWIRHPDAERIRALFDIPRIHARGGDSNSNLTCAGLGFFHVTDDEYISRCALLFAPSGFHRLEFLISSGASYDFVLPTRRSLAC
jgi:hypothetical protein